MARCATCGAEIPSESPAGWCPACLFRGALGRDAPTSLEPSAGEDGPDDFSLSPNFPPLTARLGDYELLEAIAHGGMGVVHRARQLRLNRVVALKLLLGGQYASEEARRRFGAEAQAAARLSHPGIVPVYDVGEHEGQLYFSMELVLDPAGRPAPTLEDLVANGPLSPEQSVTYLLGVTRAVDHAHRQGIVHRDLKPANVLIDADGQPRVTDFGLARSLEPGSRLTVTQQILGTPGYLSPEQIAKKYGPVGVRTDVYALGAILYCLLTGRPPVEGGGSTLEDLQRATERDPVPPRQINPRVPRDLEVVCLRCLAKEPVQRYADATALAEDLERWQRKEPIRARPVSWTERLRYRVRRKPVVAGLAAALGLALVLLVPLAVFLQAESREATASAKLESAARTLDSVSTAIEEGRVAEALHRLAAQLRVSPHPHTLADRFVQLIEDHTFLVPIPVDGNASPTLNGDELSSGVARSADGRWVAEVTNVVDLLVRPKDAASPPRLIREAHASAIRSVSFGRDGAQLVSASADGTARLWDSTTGGQIREFPHGAPVHHAVFHPDGLRIATACADGAVRLWRGDRSEVAPRLLATNLGPVSCLRFSPDGALLAVGTDDGRAGLWEVARGIPVGVPRRFGSITTAPVVDVECESHPPTLRVLLGELGVAVVRLTRAKPLTEVRRQEPGAVVGPRGAPASKEDLVRLNLREIFTSQVSVDGRTLAVAVGNEVQIYKLPLRRTAPEPEPLSHSEPVEWLAFRPDGLRLATATKTGRVRVWDVATRQAVTAEWPGDGPIQDMVFDESGRVLAIVTRDQRRSWDLASCSDAVPPWLPDLAEVLVGPPEASDDAAAPVRPEVARDGFLKRFAAHRSGGELELWVTRLLDLPTEPAREGTP